MNQRDALFQTITHRKNSHSFKYLARNSIGLDHHVKSLCGCKKKDRRIKSCYHASLIYSTHKEKGLALHTIPI